jgi:Spy/CpxP family protein refolding chaperone
VFSFFKPITKKIMKKRIYLLTPILVVLLLNIFTIQVSAQDKPTAPTNNKNQEEEILQAPLPPTHGLNANSAPSNQPQGKFRDKTFRSFDIPDLTPDQHEKIRKARLKQMSELTPLKNQMKEKKARLSTVLTTVPFDEKQADQLADEIGKTVSAMVKIKIHHDQELRNFLTPDQQVIFDSRPKPWLNKELKRNQRNQ